MTILPLQTTVETQVDETEAERDTRLALERVLIEEGEADFRAGRYIGGKELDAWLHRFRRGLPPLEPRTKG